MLAIPEVLDQADDFARRDAVDVGLLDNRHERLLRASARLQEARKVAAGAQLRDPQLDLTGACVPAPRPIPVALRDPLLGEHAELRTDVGDDFGFHDLASDP